MWTPLHREHLRLRSGVSAAQCRQRLATTCAPGLSPHYVSALHVRGTVSEFRFRMRRNALSSSPLSVRIFGTLQGGDEGTLVDVSIGPSPLMALLLSVIASLFVAAALVATVAALESDPTPWANVGLVWTTVLGYAVVFFVMPASDHRAERAFLLAHLQRTLEARPLASGTPA